MPFKSTDPGFFQQVVDGDGCAKRDIPADAAVAFTDQEGNRTYVIFYPFDRAVVRQWLSDARDIAWGHVSDRFRALFPEFSPFPAAA